MKTIKNSLLIIAFTMLSALIFNSCGSSSTKEKQSTEIEAVKVQYTCPMHSEVVNNKPGNCPKCGMALVEKK